jgi:hypothetical protein
LVVFQAIVRSVRSFPFESRAAAVQVVVSPTLSDRVPAVSAMDVTAIRFSGGLGTVILVLEVFPSTVAVMVAVPSPTGGDHTGRRNRRDLGSLVSTQRSGR